MTLVAKDPFYSESNVRQLEKAERQVEAGLTVTKTMEELEAMTDATNYVRG